MTTTTYTGTLVSPASAGRLGAQLPATTEEAVALERQWAREERRERARLTPPRRPR